MKAPKSKEAVFGTLLHSALKYLHNQTPVYPSPEQVLQFFRDNWNKEIFINTEEEKLFFDHGIKMLSGYYRKNNPQKFNIIGLEIRFETPIGAHMLSGKIDRIDKVGNDAFEIIDYKTSRVMPSQDRVNNDLQLAIYNLGFLKRWPTWKNAELKLSLYFLKHGEKISTQKTPDQLREAEKNILSVIKKIEEKTQKQQKFEPILSKLCDFCGYKTICPMWKDQYVNEVERALESINIREIISNFFDLKTKESEINKELAKLKELINLYCDRKSVERLFGENGHYIIRKLRKIYKYDFDKIREILEPLKLLDKVLKIDKLKLNALLKTLPGELRRQITDTKKIDKEYKALSTGRKKN